MFTLKYGGFHTPVLQYDLSYSIYTKRYRNWKERYRLEIDILPWAKNSFLPHCLRYVRINIKMYVLFVVFSSFLLLDSGCVHHFGTLCTFHMSLSPHFCYYKGYFCFRCVRVYKRNSALMSIWPPEWGVVTLVTQKYASNICFELGVCWKSVSI